MNNVVNATPHYRPSQEYERSNVARAFCIDFCYKRYIGWIRIYIICCLLFTSKLSVVNV